MALIKVASRAQTTAAAVARKAARRAGEPRVPSRASTAAPPTQAAMEEVHAPDVGVANPPRGSATAMNTETATQVNPAEAQAAALMACRIHNRRRNRANTSSVIRRVWTNESSPL